MQNIHLNSDAELQIYPKKKENDHEIHFNVVLFFLLLYLDNLHADTCHFATKHKT